MNSQQSRSPLPHFLARVRRMLKEDLRRIGTERRERNYLATRDPSRPLIACKSSD